MNDTEAELAVARDPLERLTSGEMTMWPHRRERSTREIFLLRREIAFLERCLTRTKANAPAGP